LFIDTEFHAEAASSFGDLIASDGKVKCYGTSAGKRYIWLMRNLFILDNLSDETFVAIRHLMDGHLKRFDKCRSIMEFRQCFKNEVMLRLDIFYQKLDSIYRFYCDFKSEHKKHMANKLHESYIPHYGPCHKWNIFMQRH